MADVSIRVVVLSISDTRVEADDASGELLAALLLESGAEVLGKHIVSDERSEIEQALNRFCDAGEVNLVLTTGGTGLAPRDNTPEATRAVIDREVPGMAEAMRRETAIKTPMAMLSRSVCGVRKETLIVNLPGAPKAVAECFEIIRPVLQHAVGLLTGKTFHGGGAE